MTTNVNHLVAANDNVPTKLAEQLQALLDYRNRPDTPPDPLQSSWTTDPSTVIIEQDAGDEEEFAERYAEDMLLEVTPSIKEIVRQIQAGEVVRNEAGQIVAIGTLRFSDGEKHERAHKRGLDGDVVAYMRKMPAGAMLGTTEKIGGPHAGGLPPTVTISNQNITALFFGRDETGKPNNYRTYQPGVRSKRRGRSYTAEESRKLIDEAIANTKVMPPVTKCPPGMASGTARFSDQFIGLKIGSTGKGGAPNWVDFFMAGRDHEEWMEAVADLDEKDVTVLSAALSARSFAEVGVAVGQGAAYADKKGGGKRALIAANDNLTAAIKKMQA